MTYEGLQLYKSLHDISCNTKWYETSQQTYYSFITRHGNVHNLTASHAFYVFRFIKYKTLTPLVYGFFRNDLLTNKDELLTIVRTGFHTLQIIINGLLVYKSDVDILRNSILHYYTILNYYRYTILHYYRYTILHY